MGVSSTSFWKYTVWESSLTNGDERLGSGCHEISKIQKYFLLSPVPLKSLKTDDDEGD